MIAVMMMMMMGIMTQQGRVKIMKIRRMKMSKEGECYRQVGVCKAFQVTYLCLETDV